MATMMLPLAHLFLHDGCHPCSHRHRAVDPEKQSARDQKHCEKKTIPAKRTASDVPESTSASRRSRAHPSCNIQSSGKVAVDVCETQTAFKLYAELPGWKREETQVQVLGNEVTISGARNMEPETAKALLAERPNMPNFSRTFVLSATVDVQAVTAKLLNGVLELWLPKLQPHKAGPFEIAIESSPSTPSTSQVATVDTPRLRDSSSLHRQDDVQPAIVPEAMQAPAQQSEEPASGAPAQRDEEMEVDGAVEDCQDDDYKSDKSGASETLEGLDPEQD